ncbi:sodium:proton antiporter [Agilicoccus flavus]|uniref:sodium:proton antiporter n=1 Tax=Agilicoccus flavus TaxID=2775968 RepID=UPI001CF6C270|nr:cation:proton antiporter subunit C [Agilicoccus flavus]
MILPLTIGVLVTAGVYLLTRRSMVRAVFGIGLLSHAANLLILTAGVTSFREEPIAGRVDPALAADPLPQAFVLTAIVITLAVMVLMLTMAVIGHDDDLRRAPEVGETPDS